MSASSQFPPPRERNRKDLYGCIVDSWIGGSIVYYCVVFCAVTECPLVVARLGCLSRHIEALEASHLPAKRRGNQSDCKEE